MAKNYLVVGGSSGIGAAIIENLVQQGNTVYNMSRKVVNLPGVVHIAWDATQPDAQALQALPDTLAGVAYCPGTINLKPFNRLSLDDFQKDFQVNVLGAVAVVQAVLPKLKKQEGSAVVFFSTVAVQTGMAFHASVASAKGAIEGLTRALAAEYAGSKIRFNCIAPSLTDTPLAKNLLSSDEKKEAANKRHPLGRVGNAQELAQLATFLLGEQATWITGQIIAADGGMGSIRMM